MQSLKKIHAWAQMQVPLWKNHVNVGRAYLLICIILKLAYNFMRFSAFCLSHHCLLNLEGFQKSFFHFSSALSLQLRHQGILK